MLGIDSEFISYRLSVFLAAQLVVQKRGKMSLDRAFTIQEQVYSLLDTGFILEIVYLILLSNVVMVKKV